MEDAIGDEQPCVTCKRYPHTVKLVRRLSPAEQLAFPDFDDTEPPRKKRKCITTARVINAGELKAHLEAMDAAEDEKLRKSAQRSQSHATPVLSDHNLRVKRKNKSTLPTIDEELEMMFPAQSGCCPEVRTNGKQY